MFEAKAKKKKASRRGCQILESTRWSDQLDERHSRSLLQFPQRVPTTRQLLVDLVQLALDLLQSGRSIIDLFDLVGEPRML